MICTQSMFFKKSNKIALYAQSGGVTSVINATACGLIETARKNGIDVYASKNGIIGILKEELIDTTKEPSNNIDMLKYTPGGAFGSCRYKLSDNLQHDDYKRIFEVFYAHNISYLFYNGGGDSLNTICKISNASKKNGYPLTCISLPKTIDNDLPCTDNCPGFGSVAKYIATSVREVSYDIVSMKASSTKIFILEVMGRHTGWIAASAALAKDNNNIFSQIILFPEIIFNPSSFLKKVEEYIKHHEFCIIIVAEGINDKNGLLMNKNSVDSFGHKQLGGVALIIADLIKKNFNYKCHWAVADYLQRAAKHISSKTDLDQAYAIGESAIEYALSGINNIMLNIIRKSNAPYSWEIGHVKLGNISNVEKKLPLDFIHENGFDITEKCYQYLIPLIQGEVKIPFKNGLPNFISLLNHPIKKKLNC